MRNWAAPVAAGILVAAGSATLATASTSTPRWHLVPMHTKAFAEQNMLRALPQRLSPVRLRPLLDRRTGLLKNNVQVVCRGIGVSSGPGAYHRFRCAAASPMRPFHQVMLSYVAKPSGRFQIRAARPLRK